MGKAFGIVLVLAALTVARAVFAGPASGDSAAASIEVAAGADSAAADSAAAPAPSQPSRPSGPRLPTPGVTSSPAGPDTSKVTRPGERDTLRVPLRAARRRGVDRPKQPNVWWTTIRSGILPGWGQLANGKPVKAVLLTGIYSALAVTAYRAEKDRKDLKKQLAGGNDPKLVARLNSAVDRRNQKLWFMGATALYAMLDAYVDAHFVGYGPEWKAVIGPGGGEFAVTARF